MSAPGLTAAADNGLPPTERSLPMLSLMTGVALASLDTAIANTALPGMAQQLQATPAASIWIVNAYQLAMVATLLPFAALGEIVGYRRVALTGLALFTAASLACALAWSLPTLVAARLLQGLGASAMMAVSTALIRAIYPPERQGHGYGVNALVVALAFAAGPTVASLVLALSSWPWLFALNLPLGLLALVGAARTLPHTPRATHRYDYIAALYNAGAFGLLVLALGDAAHGSTAQLPLELAAAALCLTLLLRRQRGHPAPLLPVDLFRQPLFALSALTAFCTFAVQSLALIALPFFFEQTLGRSAITTGFLMTPWPALVAVMGPIAGRLSDRYTAGMLGGIGLLTLCAGVMLLLMLTPQSSPLAIAWRMGLCGIGFGFFQAPNMKALMGAAPRARAGSASGMVATARLSGQATGAALVAYCFTLSALHGTLYALVAAAGLAALGAIISLARLLVRT